MRWEERQDPNTLTDFLAVGREGCTASAATVLTWTPEITEASSQRGIYKDYVTQQKTIKKRPMPLNQ